MKIIKKYKSPYLFILPFFILFFSAYPHNMDSIHFIYRVEGNWRTGVVWDGQLSKDFSGQSILGILAEYGHILADRTYVNLSICRDNCKPSK